MTFYFWKEFGEPLESDNYYRKHKNVFENIWFKEINVSIVKKFIVKLASRTRTGKKLNLALLCLQVYESVLNITEGNNNLIEIQTWSRSC